MENLSNNHNNLELVSNESVLRESFASLSEEAKVEVLVRFMKSNSLPQPQDNHKVGRKEDEAKMKYSYSLEFKKEAVKIAIQKNNNRAAVREMNAKYKEVQSLDEKSIRLWRQDPEINSNLDYDSAHPKRRQIRKLVSPFAKAEEELVRKIKERRGKAEMVTRDWIIAEAKRVIANPSFKGSAGWFSNFTKRCGISRRLPTSIIQKLSLDYTKEVREYLETIRGIRYHHEIRNNIKVIIGNVDETNIKFDMSRRYVYDFKGTKEIKVRRTNRNKLTFTAILAVTMDGTKLPPIFIFKTRNAIPQSLRNQFKNQVLLFTNGSGWCVEGIFQQWVNKIWLNLNFQQNQKALLVLDQFSVHKLSTIKKLLDDGQSLYAYLPPGSTGLLQPLDTHINKDFKDRIRRKFEAWYDLKGCQDDNKTEKGYLRAPNVSIVTQWALEA